MKRAKAAAFIAVTYFLTALFHVVLQSLGGRSNPAVMDLLGLAMALPLLSVLLVQKVAFKEKMLPYLGISGRPNMWFLYAVLIPLAMAAVLNAGGLVGSSGQEIPSNALGVLASNLGAGLTVAAVSAMLEEVSWRGFLWEELKHMVAEYCAVPGLEASGCAPGEREGVPWENHTTVDA